MLDSAIKFKIIPLNMAWTWHQADPWRTVTKIVWNQEMKQESDI